MGQVDDHADLYRQYLPRILNYVRLRVDDEAVAQDLTAVVFERAVSRQHTLRRREAFGAWLFAIARNTVAAHYRRRRQDVSLDRVAEQATGTPSPPEALMAREELALLLRALSRLPDREQEIIRLKFVAGLGNQEIGKVLRLRAGHVAVLQYRALRKLRSHLEAADSATEKQRAPKHGD